MFACLIVLLAVTAEAPMVTFSNERSSAGSVKALRVVVLSTMLADEGIGEWGFAALVEADGKRILFDTGAHPDTVLRNAATLGVDLSSVTDVVLSHNHSDHTGGLLTLRRELMKKNPSALSIAHVGMGIFTSRPSKTGEGNEMIGVRTAFEALGGKFVEHAKPFELASGLWLTGPVPRVHQERNWSGGGLIKTSDGTAEDTIPEDMSLVVDTAKGLVLLSGCGHAGIINTVDYARQAIRNTDVYAVLGGFHLFKLDEAKLSWTAGKLREVRLKHFLGAHCTGIEAVFRLRQLAGLSRPTAVVSSVGSSFTLEKGIDPLELAR